MLIQIEIGFICSKQVVRLSSVTFNYSKIDIQKARAKKAVSARFPNVAKRFMKMGLPRKVKNQKRFENV